MKDCYNNCLLEKIHFFIRLFLFDSDVNFERKERTACKGKIAISGMLTDGLFLYYRINSIKELSRVGGVF